MDTHRGVDRSILSRSMPHRIKTERSRGVVGASAVALARGERAIACAVSTEWARQVAVKAIEGAGVASTTVPHITDVAENGHNRWSGVIYDLSPWDPSACDHLRQIRANRPELPVLLYIPPHNDALSLIPRCVKLTGVKLHVQQRTPSAVEDLRKEVLGLLRTGSKEGLKALLHGALLHCSPLVRAFLEESLDVISVGTRPWVGRLATRLQVSRRTLERRLTHEGLPNPKETTDWLTLLWLAYVADQHKQPLAQVARSIHIRPHDLYLLRRRLAERAEISSWPLPADTVSMIVLELRKHGAPIMG